MKGEIYMSLGFDLNDLFEMSKVEENDQPIFISKTGEFNFMLNKPLEMTTKYRRCIFRRREDTEKLYTDKTWAHKDS